MFSCQCDVHLHFSLIFFYKFVFSLPLCFYRAGRYIQNILEKRWEFIRMTMKCKKEINNQLPDNTSMNLF